MIAFLNGDWIDEAVAGVSIMDRGFLHGDGVFETALLHNGAYFHLGAHIDRLAGSASQLGIEIPGADKLTAVAQEIAARNALIAGSLRITLTASAPTAPGTVLVTLAKRDAAWVDKAAQGWNIITASARRPSTAAIPAQLKALGRTYALLARREARLAHADDALLLTDRDEVCEGPAWNVFWRTGSVVYTPALDLGVLAGITRTILIDIARSIGYTVCEGAFPRVDLDRADEIFASMTSVGIARIRMLDGRRLDPDTPAADAMYQMYWREVDRICAAGGE